MIVTKHNAHEVNEMRSIAERLGLPFDEYVNMVPTIYGGAETLPSQSAKHLRGRRVFTGCTLSGTCGTCMPLVQLYRKAKAPLRSVESDEIELITDLDVLAESDVCSCSAGDDNPF
ncbi:MAG: hypothetical protein JO281_17070 [Pseudonocardiales bacterium]|nr:hypothetical protein [Pseudonocardiales bacterium]